MDFTVDPDFAQFVVLHTPAGALLQLQEMYDNQYRYIPINHVKQAKNSPDKALEAELREFRKDLDKRGLGAIN